MGCLFFCSMWLTSAPWSRITGRIRFGRALGGRQTWWPTPQSIRFIAEENEFGVRAFCNRQMLAWRLGKPMPELFPQSFNVHWSGNILLDRAELRVWPTKFVPCGTHVGNENKECYSSSASTVASTVATFSFSSSSLSALTPWRSHQVSQTVS